MGVVRQARKPARRRRVSVRMLRQVQAGGRVGQTVVVKGLSDRQAQALMPKGKHTHRCNRLRLNQTCLRNKKLSINGKL